ncbi:MAG: hypothetical protein IJ412_06370 [Oscillospiraceae bacterium]|nr:hypothetical protein [Oscillospiraceae bacterium]
MFKANIRREEGIPRLYINDELTPPMLLWLNTNERSRDDLNTAQAREFGARGMHLYSAMAHLPLSGVDFEDCRAAMRCIIAGDPEARILLRVSMSPTGAEADEWCVTHPDDKMDWHVVHTTPYNNGMVNETSIVGTAPSAVTVASDEWFAAAQNAVINLYRALDGDPEFSDHLLGLHVGGGETSEWFHYGLRERGIDYSPANAKKYAAWLREKYGADHPDTALPEDLPGNDRMLPPKRTLLTRESDRRYTDYAEYSSWLMSQRILDFARVLRREMGPDRLVVFFYGYLFELYDPRTGHFMLRRILECPDIDALTSPVCYTDRCHGGVGALMSPADSITAHGKLWIVENDIRSPNIIRCDPTPNSDWVDKVDSIEHYNEVLTREAAQMLIHGLGCWYMDLGGLGWFHHPMIWDHIAALHKLYKKLYTALRCAAPEVAVLVDEDGMFLQGHADCLGVNLLYRTRISFYRASVQFGMYTASDFEAGVIPPVKVAFYLSPFAITPERTEKIRARAASNGTTLVFLHGFGITAAADIRRLTGMEIAAQEGEIFDLAMEGSGICWQDARWGTQPANPAAWVESGGKALAQYTKGALAGKTAAAISRMPEYTAIFTGATELSAQAVRELCRMGGAHIFSEDDADTWLCGSGFYMLHTGFARGSHTVNLPAEKELVAWPQGTALCTDALTVDGPVKTGLWIEKALWDAQG